MNKTTVIYHSADFDGLFCREIARKFLGNEGVDYIGWDFGDAPLAIPSEGQIIIMDLPVDRVFGIQFEPDKQELLTGDWLHRVIWIDHHKSSIETHPAGIPGSRIDGVSACRLAWQWFHRRQVVVNGRPHPDDLPTKQNFVNREVHEPLAVRLAGEYDVWDKRDPDAEVFQFGLRSCELTPQLWAEMLAGVTMTVKGLLKDGALLQRYQQQNDASVVNFRSFVVEFEGLKFLALNTARCNSLTFAARDITETGHDALMGFFFNGKAWKFSLYHARNLTGHDLSAIAVKYGGGGHRGACGFEAESWHIEAATPESCGVLKIN